MTRDTRVNPEKGDRRRSRYGTNYEVVAVERFLAGDIAKLVCKTDRGKIRTIYYVDWLTFSPAAP